MMIKNILVLVFLSAISHTVLAEGNLFETNYLPQNKGNLQSMLTNPDTKIYVGNHKDDDNISMLENGYDLIGTSSFEAGDVAPELALQYAKNIKADIVLVYSRHASKQMSLSKMQLIKEAAKGTGEVDASVLKKPDEQYKYYASYWAKLPSPLLGVHVIKLKQAGEDTKPEDGLKVLAVIKDSPAAKANIMRGDVLRKIGIAEIQTPEELSAAVRQYQGKTIDIAYERDGESVVTQATLNSR